MNLHKSFDFSQGLIEVVKIASSLGRLYGRVFLTEFGETYLCGLLPGVVFS